MAKDPVCGMKVNDKTAKFKTEHMGKTYYFCAAGYKSKFEENPNIWKCESAGDQESRSIAEPLADGTMVTVHLAG